MHFAHHRADILPDAQPQTKHFVIAISLQSPYNMAICVDIAIFYWSNNS